MYTRHVAVSEHAKQPLELHTCFKKDEDFMNEWMNIAMQIEGGHTCVPCTSSYRWHAPYALEYSTVQHPREPSEALAHKHARFSLLRCTCTEVPVCGITGGETIWVPPANCVYPGWRRRPLTGPPQSTSKPPLAPTSVDLDIVDYFQPQSRAVSCV